MVQRRAREKIGASRQRPWDGSLLYKNSWLGEDERPQGHPYRGGKRWQVGNEMFITERKRKPSKGTVLQDIINNSVVISKRTYTDTR